MVIPETYIPVAFNAVTVATPETVKLVAIPVVKVNPAPTWDQVEDTAVAVNAPETLTFDPSKVKFAEAPPTPALLNWICVFDPAGVEAPAWIVIVEIPKLESPVTDCILPPAKFKVVIPKETFDPPDCIPTPLIVPVSADPSPTKL